jgi:nucleotide-binding universal stress UspA family protein
MAHILIPTDFSDNALRAAVYAVRLFGEQGHTYTLLTSYALPRGAATTMWSIDELLRREALEGMEIFEERFRKILGDPAMILCRAVEHGDLPNVIARLEKDEPPVDVIVMGTQGATGLKEVLMGSNTADVIKRSRVPVLTIPRGTEFGDRKRIVLADDGQRVLPDTVRMLLDIARLHDAEIMVVRVMPEDEGREKQAVTSHYDEVLQDIPHTYHTIKAQDVGAALNQLIHDHNAGMLVMVHRHKGLLEGLFHRSVSSKMAMHTHIPLLVLHQ